jgi:hypothetical protein
VDAVTTEGWIFMVGFRIFDVGLLIVWLIWFFRLRDDDDDSRGDDGGGGGGPEPRPDGDGPKGGGIRLPAGRWGAGERIRDHRPSRRHLRPRGAEPPVPRPLPARVRRPIAPLPVHRRS